MPIIPIRTEAVIRRTPVANYLIIGANMLVFLLLDEKLLGPEVRALRERYLVFESGGPKLYQFFTYQFLHADVWHLFGNLLFLWVFGNSVNGKMGNLCYLCFYLAGGVFAAWGHAAMDPAPFRLVGASGSIASITTAYLALFPRARVTVLVWFFFIHFFEVSAMIIIGLKIIVWDNLVAPNIGSHGAVAYHAHLAGYLFGFVGALAMLFFRVLPRDQYDILALWKRWNQRRAFKATMSHPEAAARAKYGSAGRVAQPQSAERVAEECRLDETADLRSRVGDAIERRDMESATATYEQLVARDPRQCLSERNQLEMARTFYSSGRFPQAAAAFERFIESYRGSIEAANVRLLLGIIYARDLQQYEMADTYLTQTMESLRDEERRSQCFHWLSDVRKALGRPAPEG